MTTILCVRKDNHVVMAGDGQVTVGNTVMKSGAVKIRRTYQGKILAGFAGSTADALTLFEKFDEKLRSLEAKMPEGQSIPYKFEDRSDIGGIISTWGFLFLILIVFWILMRRMTGTAGPGGQISGPAVRRATTAGGVGPCAGDVSGTIVAG